MFIMVDISVTDHLIRTHAEPAALESMQIILVTDATQTRFLDHEIWATRNMKPKLTGQI